MSVFSLKDKVSNEQKENKSTYVALSVTVNIAKRY